VHDLSHPLDDLTGVNGCKLLNELITGNVAIIILIQILEHVFDLLIDKADTETPQFMLKFLSR
jgi:hypothetical protein